MAQTKNRKRVLIAGAAALLIAGVSVGGALVTTNSTIFDNIFQTDATPANPAELIVTGPAMGATFTGAIDGELESEYYVLENTSATNAVKFNLNSRIQPNGNKASELASELTTRVAIDGGTAIATGTLAGMAIPTASQVTIPAGGKVTLRLDVFVADKADFTAAGLGDDAEAKVDFLFDAIFLP